MLEQHYGDQIELRPLERPDSSGITSRKAMDKLGWAPKRSWRDYLDADGHALEK